MKLVYLHIEKTAGTSLRSFFFENIDKQRIYWHFLNEDIKGYQDLKNFDLVGGHRDVSYYKKFKIDAVFCSVIREPVDRVISLFNFDVNNHFDKFTLLPGFDHNNLEKTLKNCPLYVKKIKNAQCRYLSGQEDFDKTLLHIKNNNYLIGLYPKLDNFIKTLSSHLNWTYAQLPKTNVGIRNYVATQSCIDLIKEYVEEDSKLYFYLLNKKSIFNSVDEENWTLLRNKIFENYIPVPLLKKKYIAKKTTFSYEISIELKNISDKVIILGENGIGVGYKLYINNKFIYSKNIIKNQIVKINPYECISKIFLIQLPLINIENIRVWISLLNPGKFWYGNKLLNHAIEYKIDNHEVFWSNSL